MHVFPATANDCLLQTNSFGLVNRHIFRPIGRNFQPLIEPSLLPGVATMALLVLVVYSLMQCEEIRNKTQAVPFLSVGLKM